MIERQEPDIVGENGIRAGNLLSCFLLRKGDSCGSDLQVIQTESVGDSDANMLATCRYAQGLANRRIMEGQVGLVLIFWLFIGLPKIDF